MSNADDPDHLRASSGDPALSGANPSPTGEIDAAPEAASTPTSEAASEPVPEIPSRPWESVEPRQRGRRSAAALAALSVVDARRTPPSPPARLSEAEVVLWEGLIASRRANFFAGAEAVLEIYCSTVSHLRQVESWLGQMQPDHERYGELMRIRLALVGQVASLATKLRLVPSSRLDRRTPHIGMAPVA